MSKTTRRWLYFAGIQAIALILVAGGFALRHLLALINQMDLPLFGQGAATTCFLNAVVHIYCPLCGGTRAMVSLVHGDVWRSLQYNPVSAYLAISFLLFDLRAAFRILRHRDAPFAIPRAFWIIGIALATAVFLVRNIALIGFGLDNLGDLAPYWQR